MGSDDPSLLSVEQVCSEWRSRIRRSPIYKRKCLALARKNPQFSTSLARHRFKENSSNPVWCKGFYFGMATLERMGWRLDPKVEVADCLTVDVGGRKVDVGDDPEWRELHNYSGVYDMVYDRQKGRLICSVYDTIQIWDANKLKCLKILGPSLLDGDAQAGTRTICFHASGDLLACGTSCGEIRVGCRIL